MSLNAIGLVCQNIEDTKKFYKILGIELKPFEGSQDHFEAETSSGLRIMADTVQLMQKINPDWKKSDKSNIVLCFKEESSQQVDILFNRIVAEGFRPVKEPWDAFWGQRYASVLDPDGNQIDLFAELENS